MKVQWYGKKKKLCSKIQIGQFGPGEEMCLRSENKELYD